MKRVWFKGGLVEGDIALSPFDRGLTLGDGLFETLLVLNGVALGWADHFRRFADSAAVLGLTFPRDEIAASVAAICADVVDHHVLRLTLTRGAAGRGLAADTDDFTYVATLQPFNAGLMFRPVGMRLVSVCRNDTSDASRLKTTSYVDQILAAREAQSDSNDEPLMCNTKGRIACASIGNVFLSFGNRLVTPALDQGILPGIMRGKVIALAGEAGFSVEERPVDPPELEKADGVFITNSLRFLAASSRHDRTDFAELVDVLCAAAKTECGVDPRNGKAVI